MSQLTTTTGGGALAGPVTLMPFTDEEKRVMMQTVAKNCSAAEFAMLMRLSMTYGLDPFAKEIWAIKRNEREPALITVSRDGFLKIAQRDPDFGGLQGAAVCEGDTFEFDPVTPAVKHVIGTQRGKIVGAWAMAHHARRRPVAMYVDMAEYKGTSPIWGKYPSAMILKVAEVQVLKRQIGISGLVSYEEIDSEAPAARAVVADARHAVAQEEHRAAAIRQRLEDAADRYNLAWFDVGQLARANYGATVTVPELSDAQVNDLATKWIPEEAHRRMEAQAAPPIVEAELVDESDPPTMPTGTQYRQAMDEAPVMPLYDDEDEI